MSSKNPNHIVKELETKKNQLRQEYADMRNDPSQAEVMKDWESTIGDGIDENLGNPSFV